MNFPKLYGKTKLGKIKEWEIVATAHSDGTASFTTTHGLQDGQKTSSTQLVKVGKNIGRSNETTPYEQACSEARSRWVKQVEQGGYAATEEEIQSGDEREHFLPMLAHRYDQKGSKIKWPAYVQKKYDGFRCLARKEDGRVEMWSRKGKAFDVPKEIIADLEEILEEGQCVDGELYKHEWRSESGDPDFQRIASAAKKYKPDTALLEYHIYDCPNEHLTFEERFVNVQFTETVRVKRATTYLAQTEAEAMAFYEAWITGAKPYEGAMVRNKDGLYMFDHRSNDLQKIKPLADEEFEIIGGQEATGDDSGTVVFKCRTPSGEEFNVRPIGSRELRKEYWDNLDNYIGRYLTVQYNGLTNDGKPRFPRGVKIRENWDK